MLFTHDVELSLAAATTLVNTLPDASHTGDDELTTPAQLNAWFEDEGFTGDRLGTEEELESLRALRHRLRALWAAGSDADAAELVNAMLAEGGALPGWSTTTASACTSTRTAETRRSPTASWSRSRWRGWTCCARASAPA